MSARQGLAAVVLATVVTVGAGFPGFADDDTAPVEGTEGVEIPVSTDDATTDDTTTDDTSSGDTPADDTPSENTTTEDPPPVAPTDPTTPAPNEQVTVQDIEVESVQIGVATTGNNQSSSDVVAPATGNAPSTDLATGSATAVGSSDSSSIEQSVVTEIDNTSKVEVLQISIIFNIGGAVANTGRNQLAAGGDGSTSGGSGTIATGSATAVGNDAATYVTQAGGVTAESGDRAALGQRTATLRIGLAMASSGANEITSMSIAGGDAVARTGDATAVGNLSSSAITQHVAAAGTNGAQLNIEQRATIVNFGLAFADTGSNEIGRQLAAALMNTDESAIEQLLALIVPNLVTSAERSAGAGNITTGNATAIGNRSTTEVLQVARANADAGSIDIDQEVIVVNAGAATATSGNNAIGGPTTASLTSSSATSSPEAQAVVAELATFLRAFLADVQAWSTGADAELGAGALSTRLGDFDIGIDRTLAAQSTTTGSAITTRQLAAVVNLAIARANSGGNTASTTGSTTSSSGPGAEMALSLAPLARSLDAAGVGSLMVVADGVPMMIVTGDASSINRTVLVLCQRADAPDVECLAPPVTPVPPDEVTPPVGEPDPGDGSESGDGVVGVSPTGAGPRAAAPLPQAVAPASVRSLPATGSDPSVLMIAAIVLLLVGSCLTLIARPAR